MANPVVTIAGTDRTSVTEADSVEISRAMNKRSDMSCVLQVAAGFRPVVGNPVLVSRDGFNKFGGIIEEIEEQAHPGPTEALVFRLTCVDFTRFLDKRLFTGSFEAMTLHAIMTQLYLGHLVEDGFSISGVTNPGPTITEKLVFNYNTLTEVLNKLALVTGFLYSVSPTKVITFAAFTSNPAPFTISWGSGNWRNLRIRTSLKSPGLTNLQVVRTEYRVSSGGITENFTGDGATADFFVTGFTQSIVSITVGGVAQVVGQFGFQGPPGAFDVYYDVNGVGIHFYTTGTATPNPPGNGVAIVVVYTAQFSNVTIAQDGASIAARAAIEGGSGKWEAIHEERNIDTKAALDSIATGLLRRKKDVPTTIELDTDTAIEPDSDDLDPGHRFAIDLTAGPHVVNDDFLVEAIRSRWIKSTRPEGDIWEHSLSLTNMEPEERAVGVLERVVEMARIGPDPQAVIGESEELVGTQNYIQQETLAANTEIPLTYDPRTGDRLTVIVTQGAGAYTITWASGFAVETPTGITLVSGLSAIFDFITVGVQWLCVGFRPEVSV